MLKSFMTKVMGDPAEKLVKELRRRVEEASIIKHA